VNILDSCLHVMNFIAPALGVGLLTPTLVKLVWWADVQASWARLAGSSCLACGLALVLGLLGFGSDGKIATYGLMLLLCSANIAWFGFRTTSRVKRSSKLHRFR
jgi:hypothetical protein